MAVEKENLAAVYWIVLSIFVTTPSARYSLADHNLSNPILYKPLTGLLSQKSSKSSNPAAS